MSDARARVVIVGGGFGGLNCARELRDEAVEVTVVDRQNHHLFQPLLYQVATAALSPGDIASPIRGILRGAENVRVVLGEAKGVDLAGKRLLLVDGEVAYDYLVIATGARHAYFGHDDWEPYAPGLKSIEDALEMRRRILVAFERAERATDPFERRALLTFVLVGGGPTGVELAGAIAEIARHAMADDFRSIDPAAARILLLEAGPRILPAFSERLSRAAQDSLQRLGVEVRTGAMVTKVAADHVEIGVERIPTFTTLWAAGVAASPLGRALDAPVDRSGRVRVERDLSVPGHPEVFVIGDLAALEQDGKPLPGVAPVAIQQGRATARNIRRELAGLPREDFHYVDRGNLATIGRAAAIAQFRHVSLRGFIAWVAWLFIHILFLIGFRNRAVVIFEWAWSYLTYKRGVRLITHQSPPERGH